MFSVEAGLSFKEKALRQGIGHVLPCKVAPPPLLKMISFRLRHWSHLSLIANVTALHTSLLPLCLSPIENPHPTLHIVFFKRNVSGQKMNSEWNQIVFDFPTFQTSWSVFIFIPPFSSVWQRNLMRCFVFVAIFIHALLPFLPIRTLSYPNSVLMIFSCFFSSMFLSFNL